MLGARRNGGLGFDDFRRILASELNVDEEQVVREACLFTDLKVHPTRVVDTMIGLDDQGIDIPLELAWEIRTVEDAYRVMIFNGNH